MIEIVPYNPNWPVEYEQIAATLVDALGDLAVRIDHIGSTSVPGLAAKDIIDVQITVRQLDAQVVDKLAAAGFSHMPQVTRDHRPPFDHSPDPEWEKFLFKPPDGHRPANIHMRIFGRANQRYPLLFRDFLRANPAMASSYAELKRRLAHYLGQGEDRQPYVEVKDPACDLIIVAAEIWAESNHWSPE